MSFGFQNRQFPVRLTPAVSGGLIGMVGVLLLGAALRLVALDRIPPGLSHDEAYLGVTALEVWLLGRRDVFFDIYNGIEPLIVYWQALYLRLFGIAPMAMRLVNVTAGLLTIPLTYALTRQLLAPTEPTPRASEVSGGPCSSQKSLKSKRLYRENGFRRSLKFLLPPACEYAQWGALLAALGVSFSFWAVFVSRLALRAVTLPLLELPAFYCLWRGLTINQRVDPVSGLGTGPVGMLTYRRLAYFAVGGMWMGAAMYTYLSSRFLPFVPLLFFGYWLLRGQARREHWLGIALFFAAWMLVFAPLGLYYLNHPDVFGRRAGQVLNLPLALAGDLRPLITHTLRTLGMFSVVGADTSRYGLAGRPLFEPLGAIFFHVGLVVSLARLRRPARQAAPYAFLLIWWLVMLVPDFITGESPHFLRTIGALPPTYVFWALGILSTGAWLTQRIPAPFRDFAPGRRLALLALALYLTVSGWLTVRDYFHRWGGDAEARDIYGADFTEVARYLQTTELEGPFALSAGYYRDWDRFRLDLQMDHHPPFVVWFNGPQTFLLPPPGAGLDPVYIFPRSAPPHPRWLDFLQLETQGIDFTVYRLRPGAQVTLEAPLDVVVSDDLLYRETAPLSGTAQLLGYQIEGEARAGETLRLLLHWQPLRDVPGDPDYAFFAHFRDRHGYTWAQADANGYAVVDWQPGVQVLQWLELPLPPDLPPLDYTLVVGVEDRATGQALPVVGEASQPIATTPVGMLTYVELRTVTLTPAVISPSPDEFHVPNPGSVDAGGLFTLRGYSLDPRFLEPGGSTHVALFWQTQATPDADYTLVLWLTADQSGEWVGLGDRQPLDGDYPTGHWRAGQWVRDRFDLTLPPDLPGGLYQVFAGWRHPSGAWLMAVNEPGIPLGEIFIADQ